jgi:hypothetical protein
VAALTGLKSRPFRRGFSTAGAVLAALSLLALPVWSQTNCIVPAGVDQSKSGGNFFSNFANSDYQTKLPEGSGANAAGDLNAAYFQLYYSIYNLNNYWMAAPPAGLGMCPVELVLVGDFPDARYFSITDVDMHETVTQHLADADIDPVNNKGYTNPFVPGSSGSSPPYNGSQSYVVPISLGYVPGPTTANGGTVLPACAIDPFEEDNLLDATQRHVSNDWNTNVEGPSVLSGLEPHVVDNPGHVFDPITNSGPNTAGSIKVRSYLAPPEICQNGPASCTQPTAVRRPFLIVRDIYTGCAYKTNSLPTGLVFDQAGPAPNCATDPGATGCNAVVSTENLSASGVPNWLDEIQQQQHSEYANITPQACYADGDPTIAPRPPYANSVAWVRPAQWEASPGPDDLYVGGAVSATDLGEMSSSSSNSGALCNQVQQGDGCVMRLRFQLPAMPATPCQPGTDHIAPCQLSNQALLRYMSLTFWYQTAPPGSANQYDIANGIDAKGGDAPITILSLADPAFAQIGTSGGQSNQYVTLIVSAGGNLPGWLQQPTKGPPPPCPAPNSLACGVTEGAQPITNSAHTAYSTWTTASGYTVVELSDLTGFSTQYPLLLTVRNALPNMTPPHPFNCSAAAVPFSTAEYTAGGGLMGPYAPLVDFVDPQDSTNLPQTPPQTALAAGLPPATACGVLPSTPASLNAPTLGTNCAGAGANCVQWPNQYWPSSTQTSPPPLNCPATPPSEPATAIYFVATQFPTPALTEFPAPANGQTACISQPGYCSQIVVQSAQVAPGETPFQPPLPVTIAGAGFGALPQALPFAGPASSLAPLGSTYLRISSDGNGSGIPWDTAQNPACQVYIANWTDTSISLEINLSSAMRDGYQIDKGLTTTVLSPLSDVSPLTFAEAPACPVAYSSATGGDTLTFTVTNPQNGNSYAAQVTVSPAAGTTLF